MRERKKGGNSAAIERQDKSHDFRARESVPHESHMVHGSMISERQTREKGSEIEKDLQKSLVK